MGGNIWLLERGPEGSKALFILRGKEGVGGDEGKGPNANILIF